MSASTNTQYLLRSGLQVHPEFVAFVEGEVLPETSISADSFWAGLAQLASEFEPRNNELLLTRAQMQHRIDDWHRDHIDHPFDVANYESFLRNIGYIVPEGDAFTVETANVDPEISTIAGPQLVVPVMNARYALNAANARWGSLYDALYGTDALGTPNPGGAYNAQRGAQVISWARELLDAAVPLSGARHTQVTNYEVQRGELVGFISGVAHALNDPSAFVGHKGDAVSPSSIFLKHNDLHIEIVFDRSHPFQDQPILLLDLSTTLQFQKAWELLQQLHQRLHHFLVSLMQWHRSLLLETQSWFLQVLKHRCPQ